MPRNLRIGKIVKADIGLNKLRERIVAFNIPNNIEEVSKSIIPKEISDDFRKELRLSSRQFYVNRNGIVLEKKRKQ